MLRKVHLMHSVIGPLVFYLILVVFLVGIILVLSSILGERHSERATGDPYESGMITAGPVRGRFQVNFFLLAVLFVIFDLEAVFIFGWAVAIREVGWVGYGEVIVFIAVLLGALFYLWRVGALEISRSIRVRMGKYDGEG